MLNRQTRVGLRQLSELGIIPEEEFKRLEEILARAKDIDEYYGALKRLKDPHFQENGGSCINNSGFRSRVVSGEQELLRHVEKGWEILKELKNGSFILRSPK